ncbi:CDP-glycerol glycerophosphotransferase family protein [Methanobrevibacter sp.]|uniref:bifunctional glycosyltransferase/CDP-glycerol:glycerophosphate glycerophosphotransferase n=1 Tax=Methanobrevibacter sp. TaxID=66852 RepID=UPI0038903803
MKTRVSVIIPMYNVYEFLEECIESVLGQTINDIELTDGYERNLQIVLVDDGSTDNTAEMAKRYANDYENVDYVYEENQGLGHARNYGCEFAEGDYIIFLDSDDVVPPNAYEWMYNAAVKNGSDITIGSVWRFNSKSCMTSNIHQVAFGGTKDVTHITESPELFYDTTAWNKLIKRSFWDKHQFQFPEGILYEDIPVTIPMHFLANSVSLVFENCYLWRIREGKSKSITQTTNESKNLHDRLYVMSKVDEFYRENVTDEKLIHVKNMKWLKNDLMIFIHKLRRADSNEASEIMQEVKKYVEDNIDLESNLKYLNEFERLRYEYLMNDDYEKLVDLLNFESEKLKITKVYPRGSHVMFNADKEIFKTSPFHIDKYVREANNMKYIQGVDLSDDDIQVRGFTVIPGMSIKSFAERDYSFYLVNSNSHERLPLEYDDVKTGNLKPFNIRFGRGFSYEYAGYNVHIPYSKLANNEKFYGQNLIRISFKQEDITHNFFAGSAKQDVRNLSYNKAMIYDDCYFNIGYTKKDEIIINIQPLNNVCEKIEIENGDICIYSNYNGEMSVYYEADSFNPEASLAFNYDNERGCYRIGLDELYKKEGQLLYENGEPVTYNSKGVFSFHSDRGQCIINSVNDYYMSIDKFDETTEVANVSRNGSNFKIKAKLHSKHDLNELTSSSLYLQNKFTFEKQIISQGKFDNQSGEVEFDLDLSKKEVNKNLFSGVHDIYAEYAFKDESVSTMMHIKDEYLETYSDKQFNYQVYQVLDGFLKLKVSRNWSILEDTPGKRYKHAKYTYKVFSRLPINKKRILFESMWGSKFSCNPRYLYEYINENYPDYECIWSLNDVHYPISGNAVRTRKESLKYLYYLATSKFVVDNVNFPDYFNKREGQVYIQTMHGTPLKTLGIDVPGDFPTKAKEDLFLEKCGKWDYLTVQSDFVADLTTRCFRFSKKFLKYGYPRTDMLFNNDNEKEINKIKERLGLPLDKKVILYAPTWRLMNRFDMMLDLESFKKTLSDEYVLILRLHHFSVKGWKQPPEDDFVFDFSKYGSIEELFLISDVLITDYSSVVFDYLILDRPVIMFTYDLDEYKDKLRGLYVNIEEDAPGPLLFTSQEVEDALLNLERTSEESAHLRRKFQEKYIPYECGESSEKIFDEVMSNNSESVINKIIRKILP